METRYYLSIFPLESLIASQLSPEQFGQYMSTGRKNGSYEKIIFIEIEGGKGSYFDWKHAEENCVRHEDGEPKHSLWMSVYRTLEHVPLESMKEMYLVTNDGRTLKVEPRQYQDEPQKRPYWMYQELCPVNPLVVSTYAPNVFSEHMTHKDVKVAVPKIAFADLKVIDLNNLEDTGNVGKTYDTNLQHLRDCIASVTGDDVKKVKNVERARTESFGYQTISRGIYIGEGKNVVEYRLPTIDEIRMNHFDWGKSAMVL
ncbi:MAG: hypothetical protein ACLFNT_13150 [Spirochaetales bacterium]